MAASPSRIEELERKFTENPRRYFAPLANEYRKAGNLEQAIAICRTHVPQQPAHMSGQIVFGQALFEAGEFDEARTVLESALTLDPENLIALRHLGDIARARGDAATARAWYQRVLDADPRNPDALAAVAALGPPPVEKSVAPAPPSPPPEPVAESETPTAEPETMVAPVDSIDAAFEDSFEASFDGPFDAPLDEPAPAVIPEPFATQSVEPESAVESAPVEFVTETMAELYLQQGFRQEALDVYQKLLQKNPEDATLRERIAQLEAEMSPPEEHQEFQEPQESQESEAPLVAESPTSARPSIRVFLGALANRRVTKSVPILPPILPIDVSPVAASPIDALSTAATEYEYEQPSEFSIAGSSEFHEMGSLDVLFPNDPVLPLDEATVTTLSELPSEPPSEPLPEPAVAAPVESPLESPVVLPSEPGVRPAHDELSLDRIFGDDDLMATSPDLRFDHMFGELPSALDSSTSPSDLPSLSPNADDDLAEGLDAEQFTDWLSGLKKK